MLRGRGGSERGSVAITVTLAMTVLLGFAALVVDVGLNWATRAAAQTAADSAALGGASRLLVAGGAAAIDAVEELLDDNVNGLVGSVGAGWAVDGDEANGEVVCWTLPNPAPGPGADCPDGSNAMQVITPPIEVRYAFAGLLGQSTNNIKARAAAAAGPAAPNNCVLCVLEPNGQNALNVVGTGGIEVTGGGIVVNSDHFLSALSLGAGDVIAEQIRVVGGIRPLGGGQLVPPGEQGGPPVPDPLAGLPTPHELAPPPLPQPAQDITADTTLTPGRYAGINVANGAILTLEEGVYVITDSPGFAGFTVRNGGQVVSDGDGVTLYLTCDGYPTPCDDENGARFQLDDGGQFLADPPSSGPYAGLSIFADRGNTRPTLLAGDLDLDGAIYTASAQLRVDPLSAVQVDSLVVVDRLRTASADQLRVNYNPGLPLVAVEPPVLIS